MYMGGSTMRGSMGPCTICLSMACYGSYPLPRLPVPPLTLLPATHFLDGGDRHALLWVMPVRRHRQICAAAGLHACLCSKYAHTHQYGWPLSLRI